MDVPLAPGDQITFDLPLPRADADNEPPVHLRGRVVALPDLAGLPEPLTLRGMVVRLVEGEEVRGPTNEIGVMFLDISREARERIIRFALEVQRDRRRRGMM